jgi:hypothetical protein
LTAHPATIWRSACTQAYLIEAGGGEAAEAHQVEEDLTQLQPGLVQRALLGRFWGRGVERAAKLHPLWRTLGSVIRWVLGRGALELA